MRPILCMHEFFLWVFPCINFFSVILPCMNFFCFFPHPPPPPPPTTFLMVRPLAVPRFNFLKKRQESPKVLSLSLHFISSLADRGEQVFPVNSQNKVCTIHEADAALLPLILPFLASFQASDPCCRNLSSRCFSLPSVEGILISLGWLVRSTSGRRSNCIVSGSLFVSLFLLNEPLVLFTDFV